MVTVTKDGRPAALCQLVVRKLGKSASQPAAPRTGSGRRKKKDAGKRAYTTSVTATAYTGRSGGLESDPDRFERPLELRIAAQPGEARPDAEPQELRMTLGDRLV